MAIEALEYKRVFEATLISCVGSGESTQAFHVRAGDAQYSSLIKHLSVGAEPVAVQIRWHGVDCRLPEYPVVSVIRMRPEEAEPDVLWRASRSSGACRPTLPVECNVTGRLTPMCVFHEFRIYQRGQPTAFESWNPVSPITKDR